MGFKDKFRELREKRGISPAAADEIFGLMRGTCSNWENGFSEPEEELMEGMRTLLLLKKSLDKPFIYLGTGSFGKFLRYIGPKFSVAVEFAVHDYPPGSTYITQPTIRSMRHVMDNMFWDF